MSLEEEFLEERDGVEFLTLGGVENGAIDGQGVSATFGAVAEDDFAEDDGVSAGSFGVVVGGGACG